MDLPPHPLLHPVGEGNRPNVHSLLEGLPYTEIFIERIMDVHAVVRSNAERPWALPSFSKRHRLAKQPDDTVVLRRPSLVIHIRLHLALPSVPACRGSCIRHHSRGAELQSQDASGCPL